MTSNVQAGTAPRLEAVNDFVIKFANVNGSGSASANELFAMTHKRLVAEGFVLLDLLANIGHSLTAGAAYLHKFIDAGNVTPMWGAWAIEPFAARGEISVKVEDLVWFGRERCLVL